MVTTTSVSSTPNPKASQNPKRPPLLPSESAKNNAPPRHRNREVTSRYMSSSSSPSIYSQSPMPTRIGSVTSTPMMIKRAHSVERQRTPKNAEVSNSARHLMTSARSLAVSFQGESFKLPVSKAKPSPSPPFSSVRRNLNSAVKEEQYRCPGRTKAINSSILERSLDFGGSIRCSQNLMINNDVSNRETSLKSDGINSVVSESGSVLSGSVGKVRGGRRVVPARFLKDTNSRLRKEVERPSSTPVGSKTLFKVEAVNERFVSPIRKGLLTPMKNVLPSGGSSPMRTRVGMTNQGWDNGGSSILRLRGDMGRGRGGEDRVKDVHELRMLHNRYLQWRFVKARAEAAHLQQTETAERSLFNAWLTISKLRNSIGSKRIQLQLLTQNLKLYSILKEQVPYLESWSLIDQDHCISLSEAREALRTSIANLPLVDGARADIQLLEKAICSAADVMEGMTSSVDSHLMVEQVSLLASELANTTAHEISLIEQGKSPLSELVTLQVNECSLRTHVLQLP